MGISERERRYRKDSIGLPRPEEVYLDEQIENVTRFNVRLSTTNYRKRCCQAILKI